MATAQQQIRDLKAEVRELSNLLEKKKESFIREVGGNGHFHINRNELRSIAEHAGETAREFIHDQRARASEYVGRYEESVSAHPWRSTALAVAGGLLLGALLRKH